MIESSSTKKCALATGFKGCWKYRPLLVSAFLIPWIKERVGADKLKKWQAYVEIAVKAAEQLYNANEGAEKKAYVLQYLAERGIKFDSDTVDKMIESAVLTLHHELYGGNNGTEN